MATKEDAMCHVLVIEDEPFIAMMIEDTLLAQGADTVSIAATEAEAIDEARRCRPDFITSDVLLLEGTGPKAVASIMEVYGKIPVIFITGTPDACIPCSPDAILLKPVNYAEVARRFTSSLR